MLTVRKRLNRIIFQSDTRAGRIFDEVLLVIILISIFTVLLESVDSVRSRYAAQLYFLEWTITIIFSVEYLLRIWVSEKPLKYIFSFYGIIDLLSVLPSYLGLYFAGGRSLVVIRMLRVLRVFRILKLDQYTRAGHQIGTALWNSKEKISVFILFVLVLSVIIGTIMYLIEGEANGFTDIPTSIYWAIVTLTTVGYGDISPVTAAGKFLASLVMILGYAIIAVPTGIVTASLINKDRKPAKLCSGCGLNHHDADAVYCKKCGAALEDGAG